jgi:hypothetical protein
MRKNFFFYTSIFLLFLSVAAFSDNLFYDVKQKSNSDPKFIIHGLFFLAWFILLVIQTGYIRKGNYKAHRALGVTGMLIAVGVIVSTFYVFVAVYKGWDAMPDYVKANRFFTVSFAVLLLLAYLKRKQAAKHKRFIYVGTLYVLGPVVDRVAGKLGIVSELSFILFEAVIWNTLFALLFVYDWRSIRKIHPISWMGFAWFYIVWFAAIMLS